MSHKYLYTKEDSVNLSNKIEETTFRANKNNSTINKQQTTKLDNDELYNNIKDIFEKDSVVKRNNIYFTSGKGKRIFNIDDTIFAPTPIVLLSSKNFEEMYMKQLESFIYNDKDSIDPDKLFMIIYIFNYINKKQYPITITSSKTNKLRDKIIKVMNTYFNKNYSIISSISTMFSSLSSSLNTESKKNN